MQIGGDNLWRITDSEDSADGTWIYRLELNRAQLTSIKPIIADCANNLVNTLDHVAAAIARANGHARVTNLYFPFGTTEKKYADSMAKYERILGRNMVQLLTEIHAEHRHEVPHLAATKEISRTTKHWELMPSTASARAVTWQVPGCRQRIAQIPADTFSSSDSFDFHRGAERLPLGFSIMIQLTLNGLSSPIQSPDTILDCASRYVEGVIAAVSAAKG